MSRAKPDTSSFTKIKASYPKIMYDNNDAPIYGEFDIPPQSVPAKQPTAFFAAYQNRPGLGLGDNPIPLIEGSTEVAALSGGSATTGPFGSPNSEPNPFKPPGDPGEMIIPEDNPSSVPPPIKPSPGPSPPKPPGPSPPPPNYHFNLMYTGNRAMPADGIKGTAPAWGDIPVTVPATHNFISMSAGSRKRRKKKRTKRYRKKSRRNRKKKRYTRTKRKFSKK